MEGSAPMMDWLVVALLFVIALILGVLLLGYVAGG